jgi:proteasome lid subunit RPN8/RPN11
MRSRQFQAVPLAAILVTFAVSTNAIAQTPAAAPKAPAAKAYTPPRTADGQPDLQGVWDFKTITPMQRPKEAGVKEFFSDEEAAAFEESENRRQNRDLGGGNYPPGGVIPYNEFWYDRGNKISSSKRTSLIVDPPDGRIPALTPEAQQRANIRAERARQDQLPGGKVVADSHEDRSVGDRCIMGFNAGPPMTPSAYNNNVQIFQNRDYVVIFTEMIHTARIVPLDGRPHLPIPQWSGSSRGRWEGNTLVVETVNFYRNTSFGNSQPTLNLVEKFTRVGPNSLTYEFTIKDPNVWTKPWTAQVIMEKTQEHIYEYACHEGNHAMIGILAGARAAEKAEAEAAKKGSN